MVSRLRSGALAAFVLILAASPALAHKLKIFAAGEGELIRGRVYVSGGKAPPTRVTAFAPDGTRIAEVLTDGDGSFVIRVMQRMDYRIVADSGDGHVAATRVGAQELSPALIGGNTSTASSATASRTEQPTTLHASALQALVDQAIAGHMAALRSQLAEQEATIRWRDIMGGLGYILGLAGIAFFISARKKRSSSTAASPHDPSSSENDRLGAG